MRAYICTTGALIIRDLPSGSDSGTRILEGQLVGVHGTSWNGAWGFVTAPAGVGWSGMRYLREDAPGVPETPPETVPPPWPKVPHGLIEIREVFGEPGMGQCSRGMVKLPAAIGAKNKFACHELMTPVFSDLFGVLHERGLWHLLRTFDGCYNLRKKTGTSSKYSTHSWGIAIDLNAATNAYRATPTIDPRVVAVFKDAGFTWGGNWSKPDGMHFQYATGY